ncbi:MAG TPA: pyruvate dehydrogenase (acetyl-transferring) E1 component subunit alpha [Actinomycetota bacterium]|nr:pyruvate dehydrogenase (acetyl-transferring) E1 component subunit alpha [Actinomycetota bacterium]
MGQSSDGGVRILAPDGTIEDREAREALDLKDEDLRQIYRFMVVTRKVDLESTALQRQGELAVYPPLIGQEAAQIGSGYALGDDDFVFPSYREVGVAVARGIDLVDYMHFHRGTWHGGIPDPVGKRFGMISVPVGSQPLHAVGWAMGAKLDGKTACAIAYFGDGASSEGDVHEAMNFAGAFGAPVVFFCQNNGWAISVPIERQTAGEIYRRAEGYGFPGVRVDGNDVLAVYRATREAAERARTESTPTLIEAITYRMGPHSTADDRTRYQPEQQIEEWGLRDPIDRYRRFLDTEDVADASFYQEVEEEGKARAAEVRKGIAGAPPRPVEDLFKWVYTGDELPPHLARQRDEALSMLEEDEDA